MPAHAQDGGATPPVQMAPADQNGQAAPEPDADANAPLPDDPYLRYAENVNVRITQMEISDFPTVRAFVSVTDENGILLRSLREDNFLVTENDVPAEVRFANRDELDLPLSIQLVLDISGSMDAVVAKDDLGNDITALDMAKEAVREFINQLSPRDRVGLIAFSDSPLREVPLTTDHARVLNRLSQLIAWGQTTLWDAIQSGMSELLADPQPTRRAMIVLSDGMDNRSLETPRTIQEWYSDNAVVQNLGFSVYALGLGGDIDRAALSKIAETTGGLYIDSPNARDLADIYRDILTQIQSEYLLEYDSPGESEPGQIIDVNVGIIGAKSFTPGTHTYRSPGLTEALARALWPGLIAIAVVVALLVIATIYRISRRVWLTVMITPLEGKDYTVSALGTDVGTAEACAVRIPADPAMLPVHASLKESHEGYVLEVVDPDSPIIMNNNLLARKLLRSGDRFTLGSTRFVFNERAVRPGEGEAVPAEYYAAKGGPPLTEEAQRAAEEGGTAAAVAAVERKTPSALVAITGPHQGQRFELSAGDNAIGRTEGAIQLGQDSQVSRRHCTITLSDNRAVVVDPGSTNGTLVNGQRCQPGLSQPLYAGDTLNIGVGEYRLE